jgi:hypothetical protein
MLLKRSQYMLKINKGEIYYDCTTPPIDLVECYVPSIVFYEYFLLHIRVHRSKSSVTEVIGAYIIHPLLTETTQMHTGPMEATT